MTPFSDPDVDQSIPERFERQVEKFGDRLAVHDSRDVTYAQLNHLANQGARAILAQAAEDSPTVATLFSPGINAVAAFLAVLKAGKICVPLNPAFPQERLAAQCKGSQANVILTDAGSGAVAGSLAPQVIYAPSSEEPCGNLKLPISSTAPAMIQYTSGSTGVPKGVLSLHRTILHQVGSNTHLDGIVPQDRIVPNNLAWYLNALLNGASVFPFSFKEGGFPALAAWLRHNEITSFSGVPTVFRRVAALLPDRLPRLRLIKLTGEAIHRSDVELFRRHFSPECQLRISLGTTETGVIVTRTIGHDTAVEDDVLASGTPVAGKEVFLLDEAGNPVPPGEPGEIAVRSRFLAAGYWQDPELTASRFLSAADDSDIRTYRTGDRGRLRPDGMLVHLSRNDSQVKIRGNRVELSDVEAALLRLDGVIEGVVEAREDGNGEAYLIAYCLLTQARSVSDVRRALAQTLPDFMVPAMLMSLPELPVLPSGKVNRQALPRLPLEAAVALESYEAPRTPLESLVADTWQRTLRVKRVGVRDNFFDLGGNSLTALEAVNVLERETGVRLSPVSMAGQTLAQVAAVYLERARPSRLSVFGALRAAVRKGWRGR